MNRFIAAERDFAQAERGALSLKLDERFTAQTTAMDTAFAASERSLQQALEATDKAISKVEAALEERFASQATALDKAERAIEKRFDSVNEFRAQLNDQAHTFMPRTESISRHERTQEQLEKLEQHFQSDIASINRRLDTQQGQIMGAKESRVDMRAWVAFGITIIVAAITIAGFVIANSGG